MCERVLAGAVHELLCLGDVLPDPLGRTSVGGRRSVVVIIVVVIVIITIIIVINSNSNSNSNSTNIQIVQ